MRELKVPYEVVADPDSTRSKILIASAQMFAVSGYSAVSMREIAEEVGIAPGSIYAHFTGKQEILERIIERCERELYEFYALLERLSYQAESLEEILRNIFVEAQLGVNPFSFYVICCAMTTQFEFDISRHLYHDVYFADGHLAMRRQLEIAVERGLAPPCNVRQIASLITNSILAMNNFQVGQFNGYYGDIDVGQWYELQIRHILQVLNAARDAEPVDEGCAVEAADARRAHPF